MDMAVMTVGVDDCFDGFLVKNVVKLGIKSVLCGLGGVDAFARIDHNQSVCALNQRGIVPVIPAGDVHTLCDVYHSRRKKFLVLLQQDGVDRHRLRIQ